MKKLLLIVLLLAVSGWIRACDCPPEAVNETTMRSYDFIFSGKVLAVSGCDKDAQVTFEIQQLYKGKSYATSSVQFDCLSDCQMSFVPGEEWIIYSDYVLYGQGQVKFCSLSRKKIADAKEDFYNISHGMDFESEKQMLLNIFGEQKLNVKDPKQEQHHQLIHPEGMQIVWYLAAGLAGLAAFYFLGKKFLK